MVPGHLFLPGNEAADQTLCTAVVCDFKNQGTWEKEDFR